MLILDISQKQIIDKYIFKDNFFGVSGALKRNDEYYFGSVFEKGVYVCHK